MPTIETKEIGIDIGVDIGTYHNTEFVDGRIQLATEGTQDDGSPVYAIEGHWTSEVIDLVGRFKEYDKVALSKVQETVDVYTILTRVSDDGVNFSDFVATTPTGRIQSEKKRYVQVRIGLYAGMLPSTQVIDDFVSPDSLDNWENTQFVEVDNGLRLRREHLLPMTRDTSWKEEGALHRKLITKDEWRRIDRIGVES